MPLKYDRDELYRKAWEKPLIKVAQEYGVSAVALGKACRKLLVPVPGRGHWAKLAHGHAGIRKMPLPKLDKVPVVFRSSRVLRKEGTAPAQIDPEFTAIDQYCRLVRSSLHQLTHHLAGASWFDAPRVGFGVEDSRAKEAFCCPINLAALTSG